MTSNIQLQQQLLETVSYHLSNHCNNSNNHINSNINNQVFSILQINNNLYIQNILIAKIIVLRIANNNNNNNSNNNNKYHQLRQINNISQWDNLNIISIKIIFLLWQITN